MSDPKDKLTGAFNYTPRLGVLTPCLDLKLVSPFDALASQLSAAPTGDNVPSPPMADATTIVQSSAGDVIDFSPIDATHLDFEPPSVISSAPNQFTHEVASGGLIPLEMQPLPISPPMKPVSTVPFTQFLPTIPSTQAQQLSADLKLGEPVEIPVAAKDIKPKGYAQPLQPVSKPIPPASKLSIYNNLTIDGDSGREAPTSFLDRLKEKGRNAYSAFNQGTIGVKVGAIISLAIGAKGLYDLSQGVLGAKEETVEASNDENKQAKPDNTFNWQKLMIGVGELGVAAAGLFFTLGSRAR